MKWRPGPGKGPERPGRDEGPGPGTGEGQGRQVVSWETAPRSPIHHRSQQRRSPQEAQEVEGPLPGRKSSCSKRLSHGSGSKAGEAQGKECEFLP